ncbi:MAG TPA: hypothetical protein VEH06_14880 [Candidatus Bathyarchaeia archaeon]|nr:hypothetical protein [Candidatus Bathyarchaeia archaeon]
MRRITITSITIGALMLSTAVLYLIAASQDYIGVAESLSSSASSQINSRDRLADIMGTTNEMIFFMIVGVVYIPVGFWIVKRKHQSKVPYILAIIGSATLIVFYIATRIVSIPTIGLQTDVGSIDIAVKVLQSAIIVGSLFALGLPKKFTIIAR